MKIKVNLYNLIINLLTKSAHDELKVKKREQTMTSAP